MAKAPFKIDLAETFPQLARPPILEAVIHWRARAQIWPEPDLIRSTLLRDLPEYSLCERIQQVDLEATVTMGDQSDPVVRHQKDWRGFRLTSNDKRHVVQFTRDGVSFSRLEAYDHWKPFAADARRVWHVFAAMTSPVEIERLGVRFINHFPDATPERLIEYLQEPPTCPANLPLSEFVYQSTFAVPDYPYRIRVIKVMQPSVQGLPQSSGLFVDCDVFSTRPIANDDREVDESLVKMRWLKNKVFFTLVTKPAPSDLK